MSHHDPIDTLMEAVGEDDRRALASLVTPVAGGAVPPQPPRSRWRARRSTEAPAATTSYVGGHPFLPAGRAWPVDGRGEPLHFVVQVNLAEVPPMPSFPTEGLLQMFVEATDTWGLTFDDTSGTTGFQCRWFTPDELAAGAASSADAAGPAPRDAASPVADPATPRPLVFTPARMLPQGREHLAPHASAHAAGLAALERAWDDHEDLLEATVEGWDVRVGGWPSFVQSAPRVPDGRSSELVLALGSSGVMMWGDVGTAHLFGDPSALASGDLSNLWWEWSCS